MEDQTPINVDPVLYGLARLFAAEGVATEVAILTYSTPELGEPEYNSNWNGGTYYYTIYLHVPLNLFIQIELRVKDLESSLSKRLEYFNKGDPNKIFSIKLQPALDDNPKWRERAQAWLNGKGVNNQGRVRSDNVAPLSEDGLLFRSKQEINLYKAFKTMGVSFAPLPVFVRGGESYQRLEPDFVVVYQGITAIVEVDGDTVHLESPAEAHARTSVLQHEGIVIERVSSSRCETSAEAIKTANEIIANLSRLKNSR